MNDTPQTWLGRNLMAAGMLMIAVSAYADDASEEIAQVIDGFHAAAASGDSERYLDFLTEDAVFLGTDEWERWPKYPDFNDYVHMRFKDGSGWNYRSVAREVRVSDTGETAWFDEVVFSETNGRFRGTGVLARNNGQWKIAHYAMSFLILNENWNDVIELTKKTKAQREDDNE